MNILQRLTNLRMEMQENAIDFYLVPSADAHNSEYVPECWQRRVWISGFDGSMGEALISHNSAFLSTDGRYFLHAEQQLDSSCYKLLRQTSFTSEIENWLQKNARNKRLGIDPSLVNIGRLEQLQKLMASLDGEVVLINDNLIDKCRIAAGEAIELPSKSAYLYDEKYSGESTTDKLIWLRNWLNDVNSDALALNVLDEIAWLFNIRGADVAYNPLVISYAIVTKEQAYWFVDKNKLTNGMQEQLSLAGITLVDYNEFSNYLAKSYGTIWLDSVTANYAMYQITQKNNKVILARSPIVAKKACKNPTEIAGMQTAHLKDAVAMINFMVWLENNWQSGVDEISASDKLAEFRAQQDNFKGLSFSTISGFAENGAIIHYRSTPVTNKKINDSNLYLLDSGGQYLEGTTDITRTLHLGTPSQEQVKNYTLVLKGHLALQRAIFVAGTCGEHLDILARGPLMNEYLNYRHGTGHGVGSFLCVHEGPQKISQALSNVALQPGMIVSNEPGYYFEGNYGIRIENLCLVVEEQCQAAKESIYGPFYSFKALTLVPYCSKLIDFNSLTIDEIKQLNDYYQEVYASVACFLEVESLSWLKQQLEVFSAR